MSLPDKVTAGDSTKTESQVSNRVVPNSNRPFASAKRLTSAYWYFAQTNRPERAKRLRLDYLEGRGLNYRVPLFPNF
jgi:hypothetical protein